MRLSVVVVRGFWHTLKLPKLIPYLLNTRSLSVIIILNLMSVYPFPQTVTVFSESGVAYWTKHGVWPTHNLWIVRYGRGT